MIAEWGHFALIIAGVMALMLSVLPWLAKQSQEAHLLARPLAFGIAGFTTLSFASLVTVFLQDDFSVVYVVMNSNLNLPTLYKVSAVWAAHEGSMLLWVWLMTVWLGLVAMTRRFDAAFLSQMLAVMAWVVAGFIAFIVLSSNPFGRLLDVPADGQSLNPLLQDPGLAIHPPLLYIGYVGFVVAFAFAITALLQPNRVKADWAWLRPWVAVAWAFLTLGIALGSFWAYYELGWGGWWFWDPVENLSLLPWLTGTALMHSLAVSAQRERLVRWTVMLAIVTFALSLLGTFIVRSGLLTSVHSFAADPGRGLFILTLTLVLVGYALLLFSTHSEKLPQRSGFKVASRESALLANNVLLLVMMLTILLGTLYPMILDALGLGKISVGAPYFNQMMVPLAMPLFALMGLGFAVQWGRTQSSQIWTLIKVPSVWGLLVLALLSAAMLPEWDLLAFVLLALAVWIAVMAVKHARLSSQNIAHGLGHIGFAVSLVGMILTSVYSLEKTVSLKQGQSVELGEYRYQFIETIEDGRANYIYQRAQVEVYEGDELLTTLFPEKRTYVNSVMPMTEAGISARWHGDIFVALGESLGADAWSFKVQYKPYIRLIWLGAVIMAIAGFMAAWQRRRHG